MSGTPTAVGHSHATNPSVPVKLTAETALTATMNAPIIRCRWITSHSSWASPSGTSGRRSRRTPADPAEHDPEEVTAADPAEAPAAQPETRDHDASRGNPVARRRFVGRSLPREGPVPREREIAAEHRDQREKDPEGRGIERQQGEDRPDHDRHRRDENRPCPPVAESAFGRDERHGPGEKRHDPADDVQPERPRFERRHDYGTTARPNKD